MSPMPRTPKNPLVAQAAALSAEGLTISEIMATMQCSRRSVFRYLQQAKDAGLATTAAEQAARDRTWACPLCPETYPSEAALLRHYESHERAAAEAEEQALAEDPGGAGNGLGPARHIRPLLPSEVEAARPEPKRSTQFRKTKGVGHTMRPIVFDGDLGASYFSPTAGLHGDEPPVGTYNESGQRLESRVFTVAPERHATDYYGDQETLKRSLDAAIAAGATTAILPDGQEIDLRPDETT